jgi:hypothetical protein
MKSEPNAIRLRLLKPLPDMRATTPPKHKTPNFRQVRHETIVPHPFAQLGAKSRIIVSYTWEPSPLRSTRKDL